MSEWLTFGTVGAAVGNHCRYPAEPILEIRYYCPVGAARRHVLGYNSTVLTRSLGNNSEFPGLTPFPTPQTFLAQLPNASDLLGTTP